MGFRVKMGPVSVSSRGRVGVRAGPVSVYGGGRRRRRSSSGDGSGAALLFGLVAIAVVIGLIVKYWYVAVPLLVVGGLMLVAVAKARAKATAEKQAVAARLVRERQEREARDRATRQAAEAEARAKARQTWLDGPPPPLRVPGRFTDKWFAENAPQLHPGQVPVLMAELTKEGGQTTGSLGECVPTCSRILISASSPDVPRAAEWHALRPSAGTDEARSGLYA